jgi:hypothetical protein
MSCAQCAAVAGCVSVTSCDENAPNPQTTRTPHDNWRFPRADASPAHAHQCARDVWSPKVLARYLGLGARATNTVRRPLRRNSPSNAGTPAARCARVRSAETYRRNHVPHLGVALSGLAGVLAADGCLVACTIANDSRPDELDRLLHTSPEAGYTFSSENGRAMLLDHFERVDQTDCPFTLVFPKYTSRMGGEDSIPGDPFGVDALGPPPIRRVSLIQPLLTDVLGRDEARVVQAIGLRSASAGRAGPRTPRPAGRSRAGPGPGSWRRRWRRCARR